MYQYGSKGKGIKHNEEEAYRVLTQHLSEDYDHPFD
jgi:hypothetical protein